MKAKLSAFRRARRLARRFGLGERGAAAVEFALVSIPFLALTFGIIEIGLIYFVSTTLENATFEAAREIRTGQLQIAGGATAASFKTLICNQLTWLGSNCTNNLSVSVQTFSSFQTVTQTSPITNGQMAAQNTLPFQTGGPGDIVMVQAFYQWTVIAPALDKIGTPINGGQTLLTATSVFRNEPYTP
ncbi:MAG TPA: TadE/TadG family type IV pilus assembly protein [Caulobacteraceae bacterium]|nr:TadE/TadG family type IV pilus assembly protein [Caulobacteraceae bacterium]